MFAAGHANARVADRLKNEIDDEEMCPTLAGCSLYTDLLRGALGEVVWYKIATHYVEDIDRDGIEAESRETDWRRRSTVVAERSAAEG